MVDIDIKFHESPVLRKIVINQPVMQEKEGKLRRHKRILLKSGRSMQNNATLVEKVGTSLGKLKFYGVRDGVWQWIR